MKQKVMKIFQKQKKKKMMNILDGIRDIGNLFDEFSQEDYFKPILIKSSFKGNYKYYESRGDKEKKLSVKQYLTRLHNIYII